MTNTALAAALAAATAACAVPLSAATLLPAFDAAAFTPGAKIDHPYFPLRPGARTVLLARGEDDGEPFEERSELTVIKGGPTILGVQATTQRDRAFEDGRLVEDTYDYYAQDRAGNVWYLGEDVTNYRYDDEGRLLGTDNASAWRAGVNGAKPGYIMPGNLEIGLRYFQEHAPADEALDEAEIAGLGEVVALELGVFENVLRVFETNPLEPDAREFKYYAPGIGLILAAEGLDASRGNPELVFSAVEIKPVPLPSALVLVLAGLSSLKLVAWRRLRA